MHSVPNAMKSQTWNFLSKYTTKGISIDHFQWFTIILAIKSKRVENIFPKFNKDTVQSANPLNRFLDLVLLIT